MKFKMSHYEIIFVLAFCFLVLAKADGNFAHSEGKVTKLNSDDIQKYYTKDAIVGQDKKQSECSAEVLERRLPYQQSGNYSLGVAPTVGLGSALIIFLMVGVFAAMIAQAFQQVRKHVYHDADNLDTAFDAGGKVSIGLTATTIVSQWTWSATLLQSSTVASKVRIVPRRRSVR